MTDWQILLIFAARFNIKVTRSEDRRVIRVNYFPDGPALLADYPSPVRALDAVLGHFQADDPGMVAVIQNIRGMGEGKGGSKDEAQAIIDKDPEMTNETHEVVFDEEFQIYMVKEKKTEGEFAPRFYTHPDTGREYEKLNGVWKHVAGTGKAAQSRADLAQENQLILNELAQGRLNVEIDIEADLWTKFLFERDISLDQLALDQDTEDRLRKEFKQTLEFKQIQETARGEEVAAQEERLWAEFLSDRDISQRQLALDRKMEGRLRREFQETLAFKREQLAEQGRPSNLEEFITDSIARGNFRLAVAVDNFRKRPTDLERMNAALALATSPGDQAVLGALIRGDAPIQLAQGGRVAPLAPFLQQAASQFFTAGPFGGGGGAFAGGDFQGGGFQGGGGQAFGPAGFGPGGGQAFQPTGQRAPGMTPFMESLSQADRALLARAGGKLRQETLRDMGFSSQEINRVISLGRRGQRFAALEFLKGGGELTEEQMRRQGLSPTWPQHTMIKAEESDGPDSPNAPTFQAAPTPEDRLSWPDRPWHRSRGEGRPEIDIAAALREQERERAQRVEDEVIAAGGALGGLAATGGAGALATEAAALEAAGVAEKEGGLWAGAAFSAQGNRTLPRGFRARHLSHKPGHVAVEDVDTGETVAVLGDDGETELGERDSAQGRRMLGDRDAAILALRQAKAAFQANPTPENRNDLEEAGMWQDRVQENYDRYLRTSLAQAGSSTGLDRMKSTERRFRQIAVETQKRVLAGLDEDGDPDKEDIDAALAASTAYQSILKKLNQARQVRKAGEERLEKQQEAGRQREQQQWQRTQAQGQQGFVSPNQQFAPPNMGGVQRDTANAFQGVAAQAARNAQGLFSPFGSFSPAVNRAAQGQTVQPTTVSLQALGAPAFRSTQSIRNMMPFEREQFGAKVRMSGVPLEDFLEREQRLFPGGIGRTGFSPVRAR